MSENIALKMPTLQQHGDMWTGGERARLDHLNLVLAQVEQMQIGQIAERQRLQQTNVVV